MIVHFTKTTCIVSILSFALAGCSANPSWKGLESPTNGIDNVNGHVVTALSQRTVWVQSQEQAQDAARRSRAILNGKSVSAEMAVHVALLNNKGLQADLADVGISSAEMWQQTKFINPTLSFTYNDNPGAQLFESAIVGNIIALITREKRVEIAELQFRQAQHKAAESVLRLAFDTERAWVKAVGAHETVSYLEKAQTAADASSDLAQELGKTGAYNKATQAREHAVYAEITGQLAEARIAERAAREELNRYMGAWGNNINYTLPTSLPALPKNSDVKIAVEQEALRKRVDLLIAKNELEAIAKQYQLTNASRYLTDLDITAGAQITSSKTGAPVELEKRLGVTFSIPIFDSGDPRLRKAEFIYMQSANRLAEKAVNIRSEARGAYDKYKASYDLAQHYRTKLVPLRETIKQEMLLQYNGMISSSFELLADTRAAVNASTMSVNAKQNFWLAEVDLRSAIHGGYASSTMMSSPSTSPISGGGH